MELRVLDTIKPNKLAAPTASTPDVPQVDVQARTRWRNLVATVVIVLAVWLPRAFQLDHFVTIDESKWLVRSANFYQALTSGDFVRCVSARPSRRHHHVCGNWRAICGSSPTTCTRSRGQYQWGDEFMAFLTDAGHAPIDMLAAGAHLCRDLQRHRAGAGLSLCAAADRLLARVHGLSADRAGPFPHRAFPLPAPGQPAQHLYDPGDAGLYGLSICRAALA